MIGYRANGTPIINEEIKVPVNSGHLPSNYLRCLVWFGLGAEKSRNALNLSFGDFLVIRPEQHLRVVAIVKLDWEKLAQLVRGLRDRSREAECFWEQSWRNDGLDSKLCMEVEDPQDCHG